MTCRHIPSRQVSPASPSFYLWCGACTAPTPPRCVCPRSPQCKELELSNPSKKAIIYSARLEGHRDFSIESSSLRIEPKASTKLAIRCTPTNTLSQVHPGPFHGGQEVGSESRRT